MVIKTGSSKYVVQRPRVVTPGWAAFDRLHRQKQGPECGPDCDPYPAITSKSNVQSKCAATRCQQIKTFSSVLQDGNTIETGGFSNDRGKINSYHVMGDNSASHLETLKKLYGWANEGLIQDILAAVNNDTEKASSVLKAMSSSENTACDKSSVNTFAVANDCLEGNSANHPGESKLVACQESVSTTSEPSTLRYPFVAPIEPDWEEEDVYLIHRRDAIRLMRAASKHSRAASNAFIRGDLVSAHQLSLQAREERATAEMLNSKAAMEIFSTRNDTNDIWKLDLHGLHASEAVNILKEHLCKIESMQIMTLSTCPDAAAKIVKNGASSEAASSAHDMKALAIKQQASARSRRMALQVITGTGNHSRGQAALPAAVRGFLIENGYHFDEERSGVIAVRPKFRLK